MEPEQKRIKLPLTLMGQADVNRLVRELGKLDEFFLSANARKAGAAMSPPQVTRLLSSLAQTNRLNLLRAEDRAAIKTQLLGALKSAPSLHISFAAEPSPKSLEKIVAWLRGNIHPEAMVVVGLQPSIAAGMMLRTNNKIFDMSMQSHLKKEEPFLAKLIDGAARGE